VKKSLNI
jgi:hypothetical protein